MSISDDTNSGMMMMMIMVVVMIMILMTPHTASGKKCTYVQVEHHNKA